MDNKPKMEVNMESLKIFNPKGKKRQRKRKKKGGGNKRTDGTIGKQIAKWKIEVRLYVITLKVNDLNSQK